MENKKNLGATIGGIVFTGFMFIGMGFGFYYDHLVAGLFLGMGAGFLGMAIAWALLRNK